MARPSTSLSSSFWIASVIGVSALLAGTSACGKEARREATPPIAAPQPPHPPSVKLFLSAVGTARRACEERIIPEFQGEWRRTQGQEVAFRESYGGSHSQALAIAGGFEADVVILSSDADLDYLGRSGLLRHDWRTAPHGGDVCCSPVVIVVRKGNPRGIVDWSDLTAPGLRIVMPDPCLSEAGRMDMCAAFGAMLRGHAGIASGDAVRARDLLGKILHNRIGNEEDGHSCIKSFETGTGDVALAQETHVIRGRMFGHEYEAVIPRSTLRIDTSAAVLDANVEKHGTRKIAEAFLEYLFSPAAQKPLGFYGFRPIEELAAAGSGAYLPSVEDLWPIENLPGWGAVCQDILAEECAKEPRSLEHEIK